MKISLDYKHVIIGTWLFFSLGMFLASAITGEAVIRGKLTNDVDLILNFSIYSMLPLSLYIAVFSRFNNPFKNKKDEDKNK